MKSRKILITMLAVALAASPVSAATLRFDGLTNVAASENVNGYTMVEMEALFEALDVNWILTKDTITASKNGHELKMNVGMTAATQDGKAVTIMAAPVRREGKILIPLAFVSANFDAKVDYDAEKDEVRVETGRERYALLDIGSSENALVLTYDEALKKATDNSNNLKDLIGSLEYLEDQRETLEDVIYDALRLPTGYTNSGMMASYIIQLRELETTISNSPENQQKIKDATELTLKNYLSTKKGYELDIQLLEKSIELQEINLKNINLKHSLGMESDVNLKTAERNFEQAKMNLDSLKISLENQNLSLNTFLGLKPEDMVYIDYANVLEPVSVNLEDYIRKALENDPEVISKRQTYEQAQFAIDQYDMFSKYTIDTNTGEILSEDTTDVKLYMDIDSARRALDDARRNIEKAIRQSHNQLKQLEDQAVSLELSLEQAKDTYNIVATNYQAGMVTLYEVGQAKLAILQAEIAIVKNIDQYNVLLNTFEHPYFALQQ